MIDHDHVDFARGPGVDNGARFAVPVVEMAEKALWDGIKKESPQTYERARKLGYLP